MPDIVIECYCTRQTPLKKNLELQCPVSSSQDAPASVLCNSGIIPEIHQSCSCQCLRQGLTAAHPCADAAPILLRILFRRGFKRGPFHLGRCSIAIMACACVAIIVTLVSRRPFPHLPALCTLTQHSKHPMAIHCHKGMENFTAMSCCQDIGCFHAYIQMALFL